MTLWLILALMTAAAIFSVLWPLARRGPLRAGSDVAVYRDQIEEIERDRTNGLIGESEAGAAHAEVARRLIAAAAAGPPVVPTDVAHWRRRALALVALLVLPLGAAGLYLALGSPDLEGRPQVAREQSSPEQRPIEQLVARVEAHLDQNPDDGRGWAVIGPVYMRLGRFDDAVKARRNALRLLGSDAEREADLGEALTAAANGIVTAEAREAFDRAVRLNPDDFRARYFVGLAAEQDGRPNEAAEIWRKLLANAPEGAGWVGLVRESLARVEPGGSPSGPNADDVAAASKLAPEQQAEMIRGMVARLADRLRQDGSDLDGWLRLVRAYMVLGDKDKALIAAGDARRALAGDPDKLRRLDELIKGLGLEG